MVTAITCNNVINKISIMLSVMGEWIKNRRLRSELVEFLEFVSIVGIYNQKIIRLSVQVALNMRPRFGPKQNGFRIHLTRTNGAPRRLVPLMNPRRFKKDSRPRWLRYLERNNAGICSSAAVSFGCRSQWCFLVACNEIFSGFNLEMKSGRLKVRRPRTLRIITMQI